MIAPAAPRPRSQTGPALTPLPAQQGWRAPALRAEASALLTEAPIADVCPCPWPKRCERLGRCTGLRPGPDGRLMDSLPRPIAPPPAPPGLPTRKLGPRKGRRAQRQAAADCLADQLTALVARHYGLTPGLLRSRRRPGPAIIPRHMIVALMVGMTDCSFPEIGRALDRDHTTVMYADRKMQALRKADPDIETTFRALEIRARAAIKFGDLGGDHGVRHNQGARDDGSGDGHGDGHGDCHLPGPIGCTPNVATILRPAG